MSVQVAVLQADGTQTGLDSIQGLGGIRGKTCLFAYGKTEFGKMRQQRLRVIRADHDLINAADARVRQRARRGKRRGLQAPCQQQ